MVMRYINKLLDVCFRDGNKRCRLVVKSNNRIVITSYECLARQSFEKRYIEWYCSDSVFLATALRCLSAGSEFQAFFDCLSYAREHNKLHRYSADTSVVKRCPIPYKSLCATASFDI